MDAKKRVGQVHLYKSLNPVTYTFLFVLRVISAGMFIVTPLILSNIINNQIQVTVWHVMTIIIVLLGGHILELVIVFANNKVVARFNFDAIQLIYRKVFKMSYDDYLKKEPMAILDNVHTVIEAYVGFYLYTIPSIVINIGIIVVTLVISATMSPLIALLMFCTLPITYIGFKLLNKKLRTLSIELREKNSKAIANQNAIVSRTDFIKQNADNNHIIPLIARLQFKIWSLVGKVNNYAMGVSSSLSAANIIFANMLTVLLAYMMLQDQNFIGSAIFIILVMPYFTQAVSRLTSTNNSIAAVKSANVFLDEVSEALEADGDQVIKHIDSIRFDIGQVAIGDKLLIKGVSASFKKGDIVGIVGESGKGKSTLMKLIVKFRKSDGVFVNDNIPISDLKNEDYLKLVSYYSQDTPIISGSILDNLNFGRHPADEAEYRKLDFLQKFHDLDEPILENGANLSGGDKQRIMLARYFTEKADIVILDEPTSSLDEETEKEVLSRMFADGTDKIIFLVTHKTENMRFCTHIAKVEDERFIVVGGSGENTIS